MQGLLYLGKYSITFRAHIMQHLLVLLSPSYYPFLYIKIFPSARCSVTSKTYLLSFAVA